MTRILGYTLLNIPKRQEKARERKNLSLLLFKKLVENLELTIKMIYKRNWQAFGVGGMTVTKANELKIFRKYMGAEGITPETSMKEIINEALCEQNILTVTETQSLIITLHCAPKGQPFLQTQNELHPLEGKNWVITSIGKWWNSQDNILYGYKSSLSFKDEALPWYDRSRPVRSVLYYLDQLKGKEPNFSWIDKKRSSILVAIQKPTRQIYFYDGLKGRFNVSGNRYVVERERLYWFFSGFRNKQGLVT